MSGIKLVLVGDAKVGKTTYVTKLTTNQFTDHYNSTMGVRVDITKKENKSWNLWDFAGNPLLAGLGERHYIQAKGAFIFCDITNMSSITSIFSWEEKIRRVIENAPIVIIVTHYDKYNANSPYNNEFKCLDAISKSLNIQVIMISSLLAINLAKPFEIINKMLTDQNTH